MAPIALRKLIAVQLAREEEIDNMYKRLTTRWRESLNANIMQSQMDALGEVWTEVRKTNAKIIVMDGAESEAYIVEKWFYRIQGVYEKALDECLTILSSLERGTENIPEGGIAEVGSSEVGSLGVAKLPRIPLPTFSGKYQDWSSFCDLFTTLVHDVPRLSDATKLHYLKSCLTGTARDLIKDVSTTSANYASTWQALKARFHNPRLIINKLLTSLMEIPHLKKESASELRTFVDEAQRIVRALTSLNLPVKHWGIWLVFVLAERLDTESHKMWEAELSERDLTVPGDEISENESFLKSLPKFSDFVRFLEKRAQTLNMITSVRKGERRLASTSSVSPQSRKVFHAGTSQLSKSNPSNCPLCTQMHPLMKCPKFKDKHPHERLASVKRLQICFNCLGQHRVRACPSSGRSSICQQKHHTLLHLKSQSVDQTLHQNTNRRDDTQGDRSANNRPVVSLHCGFPSTQRKIILATARVHVISPNGGSTYARALLDQGSESSFVSESIVQLLGLRKHRTNVELTGLGASPTGIARLKTQLILRSSVDSEFLLQIDALVLPKLTSHLPADSINDFDLQQFRGLTLTDPEFLLSSKIDIILGADVYGNLLRPGLKRFSPSHLVAQDTAFGWIVSGSLQINTSRRAEKLTPTLPTQVLHCGSCNLDEILQQFWNIEEVPSAVRRLKPDDEACEKLFNDTYSRDSEGRYEVHLPLKSNIPSNAAETRRMALGSLSSMHRRFSRDPKLAEGYRNFMQEYERLGHMPRIPTAEISRENAWYLPHHAVVQSSTSSWKLRIVFDASRKIRDGQLLNDFLLTGPSLQGDLSYNFIELAPI